MYVGPPIPHAQSLMIARMVPLPFAIHSGNEAHPDIVDCEGKDGEKGGSAGRALARRA
jgi:hypothetical protein